MKIRYTYEDIIDYFYKKFDYLKDTKDLNKDIGSVKYLLNKYSRHTFIEPVDFLMFLISEAYDDYKNNVIYYDKILDIDALQAKIITKLKAKVDNATAERKNIIIWR